MADQDEGGRVQSLHKQVALAKSFRCKRVIISVKIPGNLCNIPKRALVRVYSKGGKDCLVWDLKAPSFLGCSALLQPSPLKTKTQVSAALRTAVRPHLQTAALISVCMCSPCLLAEGTGNAESQPCSLPGPSH